MSLGRNFMRVRKSLPNSQIEKMIIREPVRKLEKLHPRAKKIYNTMTQTPMEELKYKLQDIPLESTSQYISQEDRLTTTHTAASPDTYPFFVQITHIHITII